MSPSYTKITQLLSFFLSLATRRDKQKFSASTAVPAFSSLSLHRTKVPNVANYDAED